MSWLEELRPASFRGVPFQVTGTTAGFGRNIAIHEYFAKDTIWPEDTGRGMRSMSIVGFLIGDDVIQQREKLIKAAETKGEGTLIHPSFGELQISIPKGGLTTEEKGDRGRYISFSLSFIEAGKRQFPAKIINTEANVLELAEEADEMTIESFISKAESALEYGASIVREVTYQADYLARTAQRLVNDATNVKNMISTLEGSYGRYFGGRNRGFSSMMQGVTGMSGSVNRLFDMGASARGYVGTVSDNLVSMSEKLGL